MQARSFGEEITVFTDKNTKFLQNLQNARSNSLRYKMSGDPLLRLLFRMNQPIHKTETTVIPTMRKKNLKLRKLPTNFLRAN